MTKIKMVNIIDMQMMRYINLFERITKISTSQCFNYNNMIIFAVPKYFVSRAVGRNGANMKKIGEILRKKIKVVASPNNEDDLKDFVSEVVSPVSFNKIEIKDNVVFLSAGRQSKAALIGRERAREKELSEILNKFFKADKLKIA